jgi:hypothetical protein
MRSLGHRAKLVGNSVAEPSIAGQSANLNGPRHRSDLADPHFLTRTVRFMREPDHTHQLTFRTKRSSHTT